MDEMLKLIIKDLIEETIDLDKLILDKEQEVVLSDHDSSIRQIGNEELEAMESSFKRKMDLLKLLKEE